MENVDVFKRMLYYFVFFLKYRFLFYCFIVNKKLIIDICIFDVLIVKVEKKIIKVLFYLIFKIVLFMWIFWVFIYVFFFKSLEYGVMDCWFFNIFYVLCKF